MSLAEKVRTFLIENVFYGEDDLQLDDETPLFDPGPLDSLGIVQLVAFLESEVGIQLDASEITPENFQTLKNIVSLIETKHAGV